MPRIATLLGLGLVFAVLNVLAQTVPKECDDRGMMEEKFDNTTVRRRTISPDYSASAETRVCSACLLDLYIFMGASVTGINVDMLLLNAHRKGAVKADTRQLEEVIRKHCPHGDASGKMVK